MKVLSLFDGKSGGQLALERAGIDVEIYYASEIEPKAVQITQKHYPDTVQLGDVNDWLFWDIPWHEIDLILGGSPCQGFSVAGNHLDFDDPRSKLFFEYADILDHVTEERACRGRAQPYFLLENVKMKKDSLDIITSFVKEDPMMIDSALVCGGRRQRYYWFNWDAPMPADRGILFQDILESGEARIPKAPSLTRTYYKGGGEATRQRQFLRSQRPIAWVDDNTTRWLTPVECERLQTLPDNYTEGLSKTARYQLIGNGWNIETVAHLFKFLPSEDLGL